ncbi:GDSL esterase/lipase At2g30220-like [Argentina anserina]|uniref:GDSL esterase/lipase At2g30220-like n=1 Tax=Argentina anserina TaxID=57926 RepID=UPI0021764C9E|nr:GDSL esterase/lipase At2g30220-like [Potentilla anserina]
MAPRGKTLFLTLVHIWFCNVIFISNKCKATRPTPKFPAILVFGDSTVDTGNNNYLKTVFKGNHYPYGQDFLGHVTTGRFSNGKLVPDFVASMLNIKETVPPFLDPSLSDNDLVTGVSFASGGSGLDDITGAIGGIIPFAKQVEYFKTYIVRVQGIVGEKVAKTLISSAVVVISSGTNDFGFNFYDFPIRKLEYNISGYQDFLQNKLHIFIKELYELGCRRMAIAGLPPVGCLPIQMTLKTPHDRSCVEEENLDALVYNKKLARLLPKLQSLLPRSKIVYADVYKPMADMINNPQKFGFVETNRGCCGTGLMEAGPFCNALTAVCDNVLEHLFWDSVHPSQAAYLYISKYLEKNVIPKLIDQNNLTGRMTVMNKFQTLHDKEKMWTMQC